MNLKIKQIILSIIFFFIFILSTSLVYAQAPDIKGSPIKPDITGSPKPTPTVKLDSPIKAKNIQELLFQVVDLAIFIGAILAVFMFLWIGFKFVLARGDPGGIKEAREWFLWAVVGTAILISSKVIVEVMKNTLIATGVVNEQLFNSPK